MKLLFRFLFMSIPITGISQNVGINTDGSVPLFHLHLKTQNTAASDGLMVENPNAGDGDAVIIFRNNGAVDEWTLGFDDSNNDKFMINVGTGLDATPQVTVQDNGNVGINTNSPAYLFDVLGSGAYEPMGRFYSTNDDVALRLQSGYNSGGVFGEAYLEFQNTHSAVNGWQVGLNDGSSLLFRYGSLGTMGTGANFVAGSLVEIESGGDMGVGKSPNYKLDVNGFTATGLITMGMSCSYEGTNGTEHNDFGCVICVVRQSTGELYCRSTVDDQEELDQAATNTALWTGWTNYGSPGVAGAFIESVDVFIASTNSSDDSGCGNNNDWAGAITVRLSNGDVYMRATTAVNGTTNSADACVQEIGGNPARYTGWYNIGQP
jgi:hypothetical protein